MGWYHTGPKLRTSDMAINDIVRRYAPNSVLVIVDVKPSDLGLPTKAYFAVEEIKDVRTSSASVRRKTDVNQKALGLPTTLLATQDGTQASRTFNHVPTEVRAAEAEEIGVEHLLRDVTDNGKTRCGGDMFRPGGLTNDVYSRRCRGGGDAAAGSLSTRITEQINSLRGLQTRLQDIQAYLQKACA